MMIYLLFATTLFVSAALLFWVQPMIAKMLLPLLGGTPAVWNVCLVFFQSVLLAGYAYAHFSTRWLGLRAQSGLHLVLLVGAALLLPMAIPESAVRSLPSQSNPSLWLLGILLAVVGAPFFVVSATSPLLQRWFSMTGHPAAKDPYFLYSASNLGSLVALLGYPLLIEPNLRLPTQSKVWGNGYILLVVLIAMSAISIWKVRSVAPTPNKSPAKVHSPSISPKRPLRWIAFAFVPSTLMLGVTTYITTDIASIPLLWVVPLALYLLSFILVFARKPWPPPHAVVRALPIAAVTLTFVILSNAVDPVWFLLSVHLLFFFIACLVCHGRLAQERPPPEELTGFYFWMGLGGVLGGAFNALLAPAIFTSVVEYPLAIVLACLLRPEAGQHWDWKKGFVDLGMAVILILGLFAIGVAASVTLFALEPGPLSNALIFAIPTVVCYTFVKRPIRFGFGVGALLLSGFIYLEMHGRTLYAGRNFFGISRVTSDPSRTFHRFIHGNTTHGRQFIDPSRRCEPLAYYHRSGPFGTIMSAFSIDAPIPPRVAVIGLGAGSMISYAAENQEWTFYEIDPTVIRVAQDRRLFTYLPDCAKIKPHIIAGDARLRLREAPDHHYGLVVLDAFSSDAIPVHLLTRQALALYISKLAEGGTLAMHISNRYLDLAPVVGDLAKDAGLVCLAWDDTIEDKANGKEPSHWVVMARQAKDIATLTRDPRWLPVIGRAKAEVWTDDFSNIMSVFKWK
jgi:hypothetical protein